MLHLIDHYDLNTLRSISGFTFDKLRLDIKRPIDRCYKINNRLFIPIQNANRYLESLQYVLDTVYDTHKALKDLLNHYHNHPPPTDLIKTSSIYKNGWTSRLILVMLDHPPKRLYIKIY